MHHPAPHNHTHPHTHTPARSGSASESPAVRTVWPCRAKPPGEEDVPALRRSKVRGREMVFALLEAARVEEENMVSDGADGVYERREYFAETLDVLLSYVFETTV